MKLVLVVNVLCLAVGFVLSNQPSNANTSPIPNNYLFRDFSFTTDAILKCDISMTIPLTMWITDTKASFDVNWSFQMKFKNSTIHINPLSSLPQLTIPELNHISFDEIFTQPHLLNLTDPYSYFENDPISPYFEAVNSQPDVQVIHGRMAHFNPSVRSAKSGPMKISHRHLHRRFKRSWSAVSAQHRSDIFKVISETLNNYGLNGHQCVLRSICESVEMDLLIESPLHEIIRHLLRVSSADDGSGILNDHIKAEKHGIESKMNGTKEYSCSRRYSQCPFSIFIR